MALEGQHVRPVDVPEPVPGPGQLLLEVACAGICGSDLSAHASGVTDGTVLGHEIAGHVVASGVGVDGWNAGTLVTAVPAIGCGQCAACLSGDVVHCRAAQHIGISRPGAFAELVVVAASESIAVDTLGPERAALVEPLAVGLHVMERAGSLSGATVLVIGGGPIGLAVTAWARALGAASVVVSEPVAARRILAMGMGADDVVDPFAEDVADAHRRLIGGRPSVVVECAGGRLPESLRIVGRGGHVIVAAFHPEPAPIDIGRSLQREATVSFVSWYRRDHFRQVVGALERGRLPVEEYVTHRIGLDDLPRVYDELRRPSDHGKVLVLPTGHR